MKLVVISHNLGTNHPPDPTNKVALAGAVSASTPPANQTQVTKYLGTNTMWRKITVIVVGLLISL